MEQRSRCPDFLMGMSHQGCMSVWSLMHGGGYTGACTGQVCSVLAAKSCFSSSRHSPQGSLGPCLCMGCPRSPAHVSGLCLSPSMHLMFRTPGLCSQPCLLQRDVESSAGGEAGLDTVRIPTRSLPPLSWLPGAACSGSAGRDVWAAPAHLCARKEKIQTGDFLWGAEHRSISLCAVKPKGHLENFFCQERS